MTRGRILRLVAVAALAPMGVGVLRLLPVSPASAVPWLTTTLAAIVALAAAADTARRLAASLRTHALADVLDAIAPAAVAASAAAATLGTTGRPGSLLLGLAVAGIAWLASSAVPAVERAGGLLAGGGVVAGAVLVLAATLFVTWPAWAVPALGVGAATGIGAASVMRERRDGSSGSGAILAALAGTAAALAVSRADSGEMLLALLALASTAALHAVEPARRPTAADAPPRLPGHRGPSLPPLAADLAEGLLLLDRDERLLDWNVAAATLVDLGPDPRGRPIADVVGPLVGDAAWRLLHGAGAGERRRTTTQRGRPLELTVSDASPDGMLLVVRDLSLERGESTEAARLARELRGTIEELLDARRTIELQRDEIERAAAVDPLTAVLSRRALLDRLRSEAAEARRYSHPVAVVVVDVDGFAAVNRDHGLGVGDAVLRELALRLRLRMREADALGRLAGDAFGVILPHTDERGAAIFADTILRRLVSRPVATAAGPLAVQVSIGVALMRAGMDLDDEGLLVAAGEALAAAQRGGGNRIAFDRQHGFVRLEEARSERGPTSRPGGDDDPAARDTGG